MTEIIKPSPDRDFHFENLSLSEKSQNKMVDFITELRTEVEGEENWSKTCQKADEELKTNPITEEALEKLFGYFERFHRRTTPGHDKGHEYRDALTAIHNYSQVKDKTAYKSDALAGLIGGVFHDIGVVVIPRGSDKEYGAGHSEAGAYFFNEHSQEFLGENMRKLICYSIAAHSNYRESLKAKLPKDYIKQPYWDTLVENNGKLLGVATPMTRLGDRMDIYSVAQVSRNILSQTYSYMAGISGHYLTGEGVWAYCGRENIVNICLPVEKVDDKSRPTTLQHCLGFIKNKDNPAYCSNDKYFPGFSQMLLKNVQQVEELNKVMNGEDADKTEADDLNMAFERARDIFYTISKSNDDKFDLAWRGFEDVWNDENNMPNDYKNRWAKGFAFMEKAYQKMLDDYQEELDGSDFPNLTNKIISELKKPEKFYRLLFN